MFLKETKQFSKDKSLDIKSKESKLNEILLTPDLKLQTSSNRKTIGLYEDDDEQSAHFGSIKFSEDPSPYLDDAKDSRRIRKLAHNANFLYCFALFESYASKVVKIGFKYGGQHKDSPKERYIRKFEEFAVKESENKNHRFTRMLRNDQEMLDNYDKLSAKMNLWTYMFGIDKSGLFKKCILRYDEARERRNLLTHRDVMRDEKYIKSFIEIHSKPDNGKTAQKYLDETCENFAFKNTKNNEFDMSVSAKYFVQVFRMLLIVSSLLYIYSFKPSKDDIKKGSIFPDPVLHDLMCFSRDIRSINVLESLASIIKEYKKNCVKNSWKDVPHIDKLNLLIIYSEIRNFNDFQMSTVPDKYENSETANKVLSFLTKINEDHENEFDRLKKEIRPTKSIDSINDFNLIHSHIDDDIDKLIQHSKKIKHQYSQLDNWFLFGRYKKNKKFIKYLNSLKPEAKNHTLKVVDKNK